MSPKLLVLGSLIFLGLRQHYESFFFSKVKPSPAFLVPHRSPPDVDFTVFYILAGFLVAKFVVAVLVCAIAHSRKNRERGQEPGPGEQQVLPFPAHLGHAGIGISWESSA